LLGQRLDQIDEKLYFWVVAGLVGGIFRCGSGLGIGGSLCIGGSLVSGCAAFKVRVLGADLGAQGFFGSDLP